MSEDFEVMAVAADGPSVDEGPAASPSGYWTFCDLCAEVYWQPYGKTSREAHGGPQGHAHPTSDPTDFERAEEEADALNCLEETWSAQQ